VLDDTYNSNPKSLAAALETALEIAHQRGGGRLLLALGDMLELGELAGAEHEAMVRRADAVGADSLILVGPETCAASERLRTATPTLRFSDSQAAAAAIGGLVQSGDLLLVKGSRGTRMERLIDQLKAEPPGSAAI